MFAGTPTSTGSADAAVLLPPSVAEDVGAEDHSALAADAVLPSELSDPTELPPLQSSVSLYSTLSGGGFVGV